MKILVTGADGFIGSHLAEYLVRQGHTVRAFTFYNSFNSWGWLDSSPKDILDSLDVFCGDIRDPYGVRKAVAGMEAVLHLAALIAIPYSFHSPDMYVDTNIKGTLNILQAARDAGVAKMVHTSTSEVYGTARFVPITEDHPLQAQSPYAATKIAADQLALSFYRSFDLPVSVLRPFNTYGPRQSARAVIPTIISQIISGAQQIKLGALAPTRDFSYVIDTVRAFEAVMLAQDSIGRVLNSGSGFEISIGDCAKLISSVMGKEVSIVEDTQRIRPEKSEVERLWAETSELCKTTGWTPGYDSLDGFKRGLTETVAWFAKPGNIAGYKSGIYNV
jgi:dTDP-glucose 4,6-dehydratase